RSHATRAPFNAPSTAPVRHAERAAIHVGIPDFAAIPAITLAIAKTDPTEISISPVRITSVIPSATIRIGTFVRNRSSRLPGEKYAGAVTASRAASATIAPAAEISRPLRIY